MTDRELVAAYLADMEARDLGVDYFLAQEMQARKLRNPRTAKLTPAGRKLAAAVA